MRNKAYLIIIAFLIFSIYLTAANYTVNMIDRGWYRQVGVHNETNQNTITGGYNLGSNSFIVFQIPNLSNLDVLSATLRLEIEAINNYGNYQNFDIHDVTTATNILTQTHSEGSEGAAIHTDLETGKLYGEFGVYSSQLGSIIEIELTQNALNDIKNKANSTFAVGIQMLNYTSSTWLRFSSGSEARVNQLVFSTGEATPPVPELSSLILLLAGIGIITYSRIK